MKMTAHDWRRKLTTALNVTADPSTEWLIKQGGGDATPIAICDIEYDRDIDHLEATFTQPIDPMHALRLAAEALEAKSGKMLFPGWDWDVVDACCTDRYCGIRHAGKAIIADGLSCDQGTRVPMQDLAALVRYIADMLEE